MKLVIIEDRLDRVARIAPDLEERIEKIIIYQTKHQFERLKADYEAAEFFQKVEQKEVWDIYETLYELYSAVDDAQQPQNILLFDLCLEDDRVTFQEKLSVAFIRNVNDAAATPPRCFIYTTFDRMQQDLNKYFNGQVIKTDLSRPKFLLYQRNPHFCQALGLPAQVADE